MTVNGLQLAGIVVILAGLSLVAMLFSPTIPTVAMMVVAVAAAVNLLVGAALLLRIWPERD